MTPHVPLPENFVERLRLIVPADRFEPCLAAFGQAPATAFRVNTLRAGVAGVVGELRGGGFALTPLSWKADAFVVPPHQRRALTECAACREGRIYIQNPASMAPPLALDPQPGDWVLDLAAAPGSKTLQLAAMLGGRGRISAVEAVRSRFFRLKANLEAHGAAGVQLYLKDGARVGQSCPEWFDRVLLDAPCSGEGRFNVHDPETFVHWSAAKIRQMSRKQKRLLSSAARALKPGGVLVYSTCALAPEENELVVEEALGWGLHTEETGLELPGAQPGLTAWQGRQLSPQLARAVRILPDGVMEGFFVCRLRKVHSSLQAR